MNVCMWAVLAYMSFQSEGGGLASHMCDQVPMLKKALNLASWLLLS